MPQLDKEIYIEYFFWIFIILGYYLTSYHMNEIALKLNARRFLINTFMLHRRFYKEQEKVVINTFESFTKKGV